MGPGIPLNSFDSYGINLADLNLDQVMDDDEDDDLGSSKRKKNKKNDKKRRKGKKGKRNKKKKDDKSIGPYPVVSPGTYLLFNIYCSIKLNMEKEKKKSGK